MIRRKFLRPRRSFAQARSALLVALLLLASCTTLKRCAYEGIGRDGWQQPEKVIQSLDIQPGDHVADLGSGGGYFTFRLAQAAGPGGKVYAVDIDEALNRDLRQRAQEEGYKNIEVIQARPDDPLLPEGGVDLIFTSNTFHHIQNRAGYFANARKYLRPKGRLAIIDFNQEGWIQSFGHYTPADVIKKEMESAGYRLQREFDFLAKQNFLIFTKNGS
ncbi:MAG: class I SAM-dependent methyltransferase [Candidatus Binatia bacterium]